MAASISLQMLDGTAAGFNSLIARMGTIDPEITKMTAGFQAVGGGIKQIAPAAEAMGGAIGKTAGVIGRALGLIGLVVGGISLAMQLFGDDSEEAGEKGAEAARKQLEEMQRLSKQIEEINKLRGETDRALRGTPSHAELQREQNTALRERLKVEQELQRLSSTKIVSPKFAEHINELEKERAELLKRETAARETLAARANDMAGIRQREVELEQELADRRALESTELEEIRRQRAEILATMEEEQRFINKLTELQTFNTDAVEDSQKRRDELAKRAEQFANREMEILREASREEQKLDKERDSIRKSAAAEREKQIQQETAAVRKQYQQEVEDLRAKLMEEQAIRDGVSGDTRSAFQQAAGSVSQRDIISQIASQRRESGQDTNRGGRQLDDNALFAQVRREMQRGQIGSEEIQQAQAEVVAGIAETANHRGLVDGQTAAAFRAIADSLADEQQSALRLEQEVARIAELVEGNKDSAARARAQRRTTRG